ncbi:MAG: restriction endonuclease subunit S [Candidatus Planktophila sp.]|nr:restriction endonuclease subunit S [Candidatus Planktophila sp.]
MIDNCNFNKISLTDKLFVRTATYPLRFRRNYVSNKIGKPFLMPSQITEVMPTPYKWITTDSQKMVDELSISKGDLLLTRSGTVGKCAVASEALEGCLLSDDLIRITVQEGYLGYLFTFLSSKIGQTLLATSTYGAVIKHLEPSHLEGIHIPIPGKKIINELDVLVKAALIDIDQANRLITTARSRLLSLLDLVNFETEYPINFIETFSASKLTSDLRIDGSFHHPFLAKLMTSFLQNGIATKTLADSALSTNIVLPGRFKRIYVESAHGIPLIGGKQIGNLDPRTDKFLAALEHGERISSQLTIEANQVLVTCSGTIGKVAIAPDFWQGWAASQHILRIQATSPIIAGYIYAWLSTPFGKQLIQRFTYGAVVDEITNVQIGQVVIPWIDEVESTKIGKMVLEANALRSSAFNKFQTAKILLESKVLISK